MTGPWRFIVDAHLKPGLAIVVQAGEFVVEIDEDVALPC